MKNAIRTLNRHLTLTEAGQIRDISIRVSETQDPDNEYVIASAMDSESTAIWKDYLAQGYSEQSDASLLSPDGKISVTRTLPVARVN